MKVFLSWSGEKSRAVAEALRDWLPLVINEIDPFMSATDIAAGERWQKEIGEELEASNFGIVCVTGENQGSSWLNFEAGALAKAVGSSRVVPLAIDLGVLDVRPPLGQFQAQPITEEGIRAVLKSANECSAKPLNEERLVRAATLTWPDLEPKLAAAAALADSAVNPERSARDLLEEILGIVRGLQVVRASGEQSPWMLPSAVWAPRRPGGREPIAGSSMPMPAAGRSCGRLWAPSSPKRRPASILRADR